ncbi:hypothetical protein [Microcystis phage Mwe-JY05]
MKADTAGNVTARRRRILTAIVAGRTNPQIAKAEAVCEDTVKNDIRWMSARYGVQGRVLLVVAALSRGDIPMPPGSTPVVRKHEVTR